MPRLQTQLEEQKAFGVAYAKGILKTLGIAVKENFSQGTQQGNSNSEAKYYVQVGAYSQKENADKQPQNAKSAGFTDAFIVCRKPRDSRVVQW